MTEAELSNSFCKSQSSWIFSEVSVGSKKIFGENSTNRAIDLVLIQGSHPGKHYNYRDHKDLFLQLIHDVKNVITLVEVKKKLNRNVIGQILVAEFMFKKKFKVKKLKKSILYHIGDDALELFCKQNQIDLFNLHN